MGNQNPNVVAEALLNLGKYDKQIDSMIEKLPLTKPDAEGGPPEVLSTFPIR